VHENPPKIGRICWCAALLFAAQPFESGAQVDVLLPEQIQRSLKFPSTVVEVFFNDR
jgi:hypothetical protein